jgi:hypothetical protein
MASKVVPLLILLLSIDVFFMLAHIAYLLGWLTNSFWSVEKDSSFSEWYQHLKEGSIVALLIYHSFKIKKIDYLPWGLLFLYVLLDDALMVHEKLGGTLIMHLTYLSFHPCVNKTSVSLSYRLFLVQGS